MDQEVNSERSRVWYMNLTQSSNLISGARESNPTKGFSVLHCATQLYQFQFALHGQQEGGSEHYRVTGKHSNPAPMHMHVRTYVRSHVHTHTHTKTCTGTPGHRHILTAPLCLLVCRLSFPKACSNSLHPKFIVHKITRTCTHLALLYTYNIQN